MSNERSARSLWEALPTLALLALALIFGEWRTRESREKAREREYQRLGLRQGRDYAWFYRKGQSARIRLHPEGRQRLAHARKKERTRKALAKVKENEEAKEANARQSENTEIRKRASRKTD